MKIGQRYNKLTSKEYTFYIDNYKKYTDFNTLGLYRSIVENENLSIPEKIEIRNYAHRTFKKSFDFLQLKDPDVFIKVSTLGETLTKADERQLWDDIRKNQQRILTDKRIRHRNFGTYSKHNCIYEDCIWNGVMIRQGSGLAECNIHFYTDKNRYPQAVKSQQRKSDRKDKRRFILRELDND